MIQILENMILFIGKIAPYLFIVLMIIALVGSLIFTKIDYIKGLKEFLDCL